MVFALEPQSRKIALKKELELKSKEKVRQFNELLTNAEDSIDLSKVTYDHSPSIKRPQNAPRLSQPMKKASSHLMLRKSATLSFKN